MFAATSVMILIYNVFLAPTMVSSSGSTNAGGEMEKEVSLAELVPDSYRDWQIDGADGSYDKQTIFKYMNGAGEVYLSYDYREMFVRRFSKPGEEGITVELYDMGVAADAYGIFSRNRAGEDVGIGQGSEYRSGYMVFWKGRYFGTVYTMMETEDSKNAVFEISRLIAGKIYEQGSIPQIVSLLPQEDLIKKTVRFFHKYTDLNQHYFISDDNILNLGMETNAVMANYSTEDELIYFLIIHYPNSDVAAETYSAFIDIYIPEGKDSGLVQVEDGLWTAVILLDEYIIVVLDAPTANRAEELLIATTDIIKGAEK